MLRGMTWQSLKHLPSLMALYFVVGLAPTLDLISLTRTAIYNPDVSWRHKAELRPFDYYQDGKQYKLMALSMDYKNLPPNPAPKLPPPP
ncbi:hypothetical protein BV898_00197 [Hypsibius exemplaris]|uniref:Uncharacterized protein n=1 Tax=Hypsibius exemplaris TaxID=2072580 RepID=A0A1W0XF13_HYPEX|nr:hypothetical protein BV898_00197 [Hypsibius exemplaris]